MLAEGKYEAKIMQHGLVKSSKDTPGVEFRCRLAEPDQVVTVTLWLSGGALPRAKSVIGAFGFSGKISQLDPRHPNHKSLAGEVVQLRCKHETYQGETRAKFEFIGGGSEAASPNEFEKFDALWDGEYIATDDDVPY
jgi:hypothetical protein